MSKIFDKIQKLMVLGNSSTFSGEAETALKMAHDLMTANGITMADLDAAGRERELGKLGEWKDKEKAYKIWEKHLAGAMARLFDSQLVISSEVGARKQIFKFIGREDNVRSAMIMFDWIRDKLWSDAKKKFVPYSASACNSYCVGAVNVINSRVNEMKKVDESEGWGLVVVDEARQYTKQLYPSLIKSTSRSTVRDSSAYNSGRADGANIGLNKQFGLKAIGA